MSCQGYCVMKSTRSHRDNQDTNVPSRREKESNVSFLAQAEGLNFTPLSELDITLTCSSRGNYEPNRHIKLTALLRGFETRESRVATKQYVLKHEGFSILFYIGCSSTFNCSAESSGLPP